MKTLCITGVHSAELSYIEAIFVQAGMALPRPSQRNETLTISSWHDQIQSRIQEIARDQGPVELGRVWEQLASDLFVANLDQPVWGWSNVQSIALLDFWQAFDPQIRFVFVACSVQRYIAHALEAEDAFPPLKVLVQKWAAEHLQMLQFYHQYPQKTVLIDIDHCIDNPAGLLKVCEQNWKLGLSKVHFPSQTAIKFSAMTRFLSNELSQGDTQWQSLQDELLSSVTPIGTLWKQSTQLNINDVVRAYREPSPEVELLRAQLANAEQLNATLNAKNKEVDSARQQSSSSSDAIIKELQTKLANAEQQNTILTAKNKEADSARQHSSSSSDAIVKELQTKLANAEQQNTTLTAQHKEAVEESELLLLQLHQVQEELEHYFLKYQESKQLIEYAGQRWQRMLLRVPDYFDLQSAEVSAVPETSSEALNWCLKGLNAAGRQISELSLKTFVVGDVACLELPRRIGDEELFQRWPVAATSDDVLLVALFEDGTDPQLAQGLLQLGRSDWSLLQLIVSALISSLDTPSLSPCSDGVVIDQTPAALRTLQERLARVPAVFRFDALTLKREQVNPDYEHLWFHFQHVAIGQTRLLDFEFRVSCANVRPNSFGLFPKLEFPEASGRAAISEWFDEAYDDFGAKLELRFALPQSMDMAVWSRLSLSDQAFVRQLITQLPALLSELEGSGVKIKRGWSDWHELAKNMGNICDACTAVVKPKPKRVRVKK
jgi:hypothetical protein